MALLGVSGGKKASLCEAVVGQVFVLLYRTRQVNNTTRTTTEQQTRDNTSVTDRVKRRDLLP